MTSSLRSCLCAYHSLCYSAPLCVCACGGRILTLRGACACGHVVIVWTTTTLTVHCCSRLRRLCGSQPPHARLKARAHPHHTYRVRDGGYCSIGPCVYMGHCVCLLLLLPLAKHAHVRVCVCRPPCASGPCGTHILGHVYASPMCVCLPGAHESGVSVSSCACVACLIRPEAFHRLCVTDHDPCFSLSVGGDSRPP
jgi:hypothetical protein